MNGKLTFGDKSIDLPIIEGTEKEKAIDIGKLRSTTGLITLDSGYSNTGSAKSKITYLNGEEGILRHRGYRIEDLALNCTFLEVAYLVIFGDLPSKEKLDNFSERVMRHALIDERIKDVFKAFPLATHPMALLEATTVALSAFYSSSEVYGKDTKDDLERNIFRLLGKLPSLVAYSYKKKRGLPYAYPNTDLNYVENFLQMVFNVPTRKYNSNPLFREAIEKLLILHVDHELNCSTSTVRMIGSSEANLYSSISGGISALSGALHGGANQAVLEMLEQIYQQGGNIKMFIERAKDKNDSFKLMGFGHRVYKNFDPRAVIVKDLCRTILKEQAENNPLFDLALELEEQALQDSYFQERKLYPNIDFYSGLIYKAMGFSNDMFTALFVVGRLPGWIAHWVEMRNDPHSRIDRPRQVYTGATERKFTPIKERS